MIDRLSLHLYYRLRNRVLHVYVLFSRVISHRDPRVLDPLHRPELPSFQRSGVGIPRSVAILSSSSLGTAVPIPPYVLLYPFFFRVTRRGLGPGALKGPQRAPPGAPLR